MPELPEVETIKRQLARKIVGKRLQGQKITKVRRRGKLLIVAFHGGGSLIFHLKMTGQLIFNGEVGPYTRHIFKMDDRSCLIFNDVRRFGWFKRVNNVKAELSFLGPEPLEVDLKSFEGILKKRPRSRIKSLLMDQKALAGIGNIYSDEILYVSRVRPLRKVATLKPSEAARILTNTKKILQSAIKKRGSSSRNYRDLFGKEGNYARFHKVYQQKQCYKCKGGIKRVKIGGRSAHYCASCQK